MNTAEGDQEHALKNYPAWKKVRLALGHSLPATADAVLRVAFANAWEAGHQAGYRQGAKDEATLGGDEGCRFGL